MCSGGVAALDFALSAAAGAPEGKAPSGAVPSGMAWILVQCAATDAACAAIIRAIRAAVGASAGGAGKRVDARGEQREIAQASMLASMKEAQAAFAMNFDMSMSSSESDDDGSGEVHSECEDSDASVEDAGASTTASTSGADDDGDTGADARAEVGAALEAVGDGAVARGGAVAAKDDARAAPPVMPEVCVMCHEEVSADEIDTSSMGRFAHVQRSTLAFHSQRRYVAALDRARIERADGKLQECAPLPRHERLRGVDSGVDGGDAAAPSSAPPPNR